jgi:hypothetical protein
LVVLDHNHAVAVFDAEEKAGFELIDDDDGLGLTKDGGGNGGVATTLEFLKNGFAGFNAIDEVGAGHLSAHDGGTAQGDKKEQQDFFHDEAKWVN